MALVIEDGSSVANATSYIDVDYLRAYAEARGREVPADDADIEPHIIRAMDRIEARLSDLKGRFTYDGQTLAFPRYGMFLFGRQYPFPYNEVPPNILKAQAEYTLASLAGNELMPTRADGAIKRDKVGPIETEYFEAAPYAPVVQAAEELLAPFLAHNGLYAVRV